MSEPTNWPFKAWLRLAVLQMGQTAESFWSMDVIDWFTLCKRQGVKAMSPAEFEDLQKQFPDQEIKHER